MVDLAGWLRKGLGRTALFLKNNPGPPWRDKLLHGCTHRLVYDRHCEPSRAPYLWELIQITGEPRFYHDGILEALAGDDEDLEFEQIFEIAAIFAAKGSAGAKAAMYSAFDRRGFAEAGVTCAEQLVILDGWSAFLFVMQSFGGVDPSDRPWQFCSLWETLQTHHGERTLPRELRVFQREREEVEEVWRPGRTRAKRLDYEEIRSRIVSRGRGGAQIMWSKSASDDDMRKLAEDLLRETDLGRIHGFLRMFQERAFPGPLERLVQLAGHTELDVARAALAALAHFKSPELRAIALRAAADFQKHDAAVRMLVRNRARGDEQILAQLLKKNDEPDPYHRLGCQVLDFVAAHPGSQNEKCLLLLYENGPCALCRRQAVKELLSIRRLPAWMLEECCHDSDAEIRELVAQ